MKRQTYTDDDKWKLKSSFKAHKKRMLDKIKTKRGLWLVEAKPTNEHLITQVQIHKQRI